MVLRGVISFKAQWHKWWTRSQGIQPSELGQDVGLVILLEDLVDRCQLVDYRTVEMGRREPVPVMRPWDVCRGLHIGLHAELQTCQYGSSSADRNRLD
jgi:hypothetical protein